MKKADWIERINGYGIPLIQLEDDTNVTIAQMEEADAAIRAAGAEDLNTKLSEVNEVNESLMDEVKSLQEQLDDERTKSEKAPGATTGKYDGKLYKVNFAAIFKIDGESMRKSKEEIAASEELIGKLVEIRSGAVTCLSDESEKED